MTRLLLRWLALAPAMWISLAAILWFGFRTVDLRFEIFAALVIVPAIQAAALTWAIAGRQQAPSRLISEIGRLPFGGVATLADAALLVAGLVFWSRGRLGFGVTGSLQIVWAATKALAAGAFLAMPREGRVDGRRLAVGAAALVVGTSGFTGWLGALPALLAGLVGHLPLVIAYLVTYGTGMAVLVVLMLRLGHTWPPTSAGRLLVDCSVAALLAASIVLVLNGFKYRVPMDPYRGVALVASSLAASALLLAAELPRSKD